MSHVPAYIPVTYSRIEPVPPAIPPGDSELSLLQIIKEVVSNIKPGSEITNIKLPASVLDAESTLEKTKKSMQRGELLQDICAAQDPEARFLNVLRFNLSGLARERFGKKPYNPVLGEVFRCCFPHRGAGGETVLVAEQVSHHPPITALHLRNDTLGIRMNSYTAPESRWWGNSLDVKLLGEIRLVLTKFDNEEYLITRPYIHLTGFFMGRQRFEFCGTSTFRCERTRLAAEIEYKVKSALNIRADSQTISGRVYNLDTGNTIYTLDGQWDKKVTLTHATTKAQRVLFDYEAVLNEKSMVAVLPPEEETEESFSTKVWASCTRAIRSGNTLAANTEKRKVEEHQRCLRKERHNAKIEWQHRYFQKRSEGGGYDLKPDFGTISISKLCLSSGEIERLRSGDMVKTVLQEQAAAEQDVVDGNKKMGRRRLLGRRGKDIAKV